MSVELSQVEAFRRLPPGSLTRLAMHCRKRTLAAGSPLMREGDRGQCLYVMLRGRARVEASHVDPLKGAGVAELGPGQVVGLSGLLDGEPCPSTITAIEAVEVIELGYVAIALTALQYPEVAGLLTALSRGPHPINRSAG